MSADRFAVDGSAGHGFEYVVLDLAGREIQFGFAQIADAGSEAEAVLAIALLHPCDCLFFHTLHGCCCVLLACRSRRACDSSELGSEVQWNGKPG